MTEEREEIKRHMGVLQDGFIEEFKTIGEGQSFLRKDIRDVKDELKKDIQTVESNIGVAIQKLARDVKEVKEEVKKHEGRLSHP